VDKIGRAEEDPRRGQGALTGKIADRSRRPGSSSSEGPATKSLQGLREPALDATAGSALLNERHGLDFIPYLRLAILRWGGSPGLDGHAELTEGLEPF
jgi:hypothetical protein